MINHQLLSVRAIETKDIPLITKYWLESEPDFLIGMGVDLNKLPTKEGLRQMLEKQMSLAIDKKPSYALIWEYNHKAIGHCNVNGIKFGEEAFMHLHLWNIDKRQKGIGSLLVKKSVEIFFKELKLQQIFSEPYALNPAPNKTLKKLGFDFVKKYTTIPGSLNFEQEVNRWKIEKSKFITSS